MSVAPILRDELPTHRWIVLAPPPVVAGIIVLDAFLNGRTEYLGNGLLVAGLWPWLLWVLARSWPGSRIRALPTWMMSAWSSLLMLVGIGMTLWISGTTFDAWWQAWAIWTTNMLLEVMANVEAWQGGLAAR